MNSLSIHHAIHHAPFVSTRARRAQAVSFTQAILSPAAMHKGLYTLATLPCIDFSAYMGLSYHNLTKAIFSHLAITLDEAILNAALARYDDFDTLENPAPIKALDNAYVLELYHGPTRAFKDMALSPFGEIFSALCVQENKRYLILTATSGDTGPATLHALANKPNVKVLCLYPHQGTSEIQALQMQTTSANNCKVLGIYGDFDEAQRLIKSLLHSPTFLAHISAKGYALSAANSVNFGRIAFQIIYYVWGYYQLVRQGIINYGDKISVSVPSGNFGNALGAFLAKNMGLPIRQILIASNQNNILTELITSGIYDISARTLHHSIAPAMDILQSSNIERVLFHLYGDTRTKELLESLEIHARYALTQQELALLQEHFCAWWGGDEEALYYIKQAYDKGYIMDPHTALAYGAHMHLSPTEPTLICATAEWSKFAPSVVEAIYNKRVSDKEALHIMQDSSTPLSPHITELFTKPIIHTQVLASNQVEAEIISWL